MSMRLVGGHSGELDKEESKHCEDERLYEANEHLEGHEGSGEEIGEEETRHENHHLASKDMAEESEGEGNEPPKVAHELDKADDKAKRRAQIYIFSGIAEEAESGDTGNLDGEKTDSRECKSKVEVSCRCPQEREEPVCMDKSKRAYSRDKL